MYPPPTRVPENRSLRGMHTCSRRSGTCACQQIDPSVECNGLDPTSECLRNISSQIRLNSLFFFRTPLTHINIGVSSCTAIFATVIDPRFPRPGCSQGSCHSPVFLHARLVGWYVYLVTTYIHDFKTPQEPNKTHNGAPLQLEVLDH